jgi:hypothetical protein
MLLILVCRQQAIKMQSARPKLQSDSSKFQQQNLQVTPILDMYDERKSSESVDKLIKQQEYTTSHASKIMDNIFAYHGL